VAEIDLGTQPARNIEHVDGRFFIATGQAVHVVDGDALAPVPMIEAAEVIDLRGSFVLTDRAIVEIGGATCPLPPLDGAQPATFLPLLDGAIVALHDERDPTKAAVWRLDRDGKSRWRTSMPVPSQLLAEREQLWPGGQDKDVVPLRRHRLPVQWTISRRGLCMSRDRLLAVFVSSPGIGIGFGIDVETGSVLYATPPAPHGELAPAPATAAGPGAFFVGLQGYGFFETSLVDRDGRAVTRWQSHGIVLPGDPVRVIEKENRLPSRCRVSTLHADGTVARGVHLPSYYTSPVVIAADGSAVFWRDHAVTRVSPDGKLLERLLETPNYDSMWSEGFAGHAPGRVVLSLSASTKDIHDLTWHYGLLIIDLEV